MKDLRKDDEFNQELKMLEKQEKDVSEKILITRLKILKNELKEFSNIDEVCVGDISIMREIINIWDGKEKF